MSCLLSLQATSVSGHDVEIRMWERSSDDDISGREEGESDPKNANGSSAKGDNSKKAEQQQSPIEQRQERSQASLLREFYAKESQCMSRGKKDKIRLLTTLYLLT